MPIEELLPAGLRPPPAHTDMLLELAYLVAAVDGRLADEELTAFGVLAAKLVGREWMTSDEVDAYLGRFSHNVDWNEIEPRVKALAASLPKDLHAVAYRLALGLAFVDHEPSEAEDRLHKTLGDALDLTPELRAALSRQVELGGGKARTKAR